MTTIWAWICAWAGFFEERCLSHPERCALLARAHAEPIGVAGFAGEDERAQDRARYHIRILLKHGALEAIPMDLGTGSAEIHYRATPRYRRIGRSLEKFHSQGGQG